MPSRNHQAELLGRVPLFSACSKKELRNLASLVSEVSFPAGAVLAREGEPGEEAFVVVSGEVDVTIGKKKVATVGPGEILGEMSLLDLGPRSATATARTEVDLFVLNPREFASMIDDSPSVARKMLRTLASRLRAVERAATH